MISPLRNLGFRWKLSLPIIILAFAILLVGVYTKTTLDGVIYDQKSLAGRYLPGVRAILEADNALLNAKVAERSMLNISPMTSEFGEIAKAHRESVDAFPLHLQEVEDSFSEHGPIKEQIKSLNAIYEKWKKITLEISAARERNTTLSNDSANYQSYGDGAILFNQMRLGIEAIANDIINNAGDFSMQSTNRVEKNTANVLIGLAFALGICLFLLAAFPPLITRPLNAMLKRVHDLTSGEGNLAKRLNVESKDELGRLSQEFNCFLEQLQKLVTRVIETTAQVASAAEELQQSSTNATQNIKRQHVALDQVSSAVTEMSATVNVIAENAHELADYTTKADREATRVKQATQDTVVSIENVSREVEDTANTIHELGQQAENIGTVLNVIRGVAEQTNLLALNAAIEAARAGDQGRGFAVVADEVRSLANTSQMSTQDIQNMITALQAGARESVAAIQGSRASARDTVETVNASVEQIETIIAMASATNHMTTQIATATSEQSKATDEITRNITEIADISEKAAKTATQTSYAADRMAKLAHDLNALVSHFQV